MNLFLVAKVTAETENGRVWECQGVFDSRDRAISECRDWRYCICPIVLNEPAPKETVEFPNAEYPIARPAETLTGGVQ